MLAVNAIVLLFYLFWGACSVFAQSSNHLKDKVKALDLFNIVPNYHFFCPVPSRYDYHLYYRSLTAAEGMNEWQEIVIGSRHALFGCLWNPLKRDRKIFYKVIKIIKKRSASPGRKGYGALYQSLLNFIKHQDHAPGSLAVQFKITLKQDHGEDTSENLFHESAFHPAIQRL